MPVNSSDPATPVVVFPPNSRYHGTATAEQVMAGSRRVVFLQRRFLPRPDAFQILFEHKPDASDRLDLIAAEHLGDPLLFWRLCDANGAMRPNELLEQERIAITLPEGIQGTEL